MFFHVLIFQYFFRAMSSSATKGEFLNQLELIVERILQNKAKVNIYVFSIYLFPLKKPSQYSFSFKSSKLCFSVKRICSSRVSGKHCLIYICVCVCMYTYKATIYQVNKVNCPINDHLYTITNLSSLECNCIGGYSRLTLM